LAKTKTSKNGLKTGLKTKTGLKDYITGRLGSFVATQSLQYNYKSQALNCL